MLKKTALSFLFLLALIPIPALFAGDDCEPVIYCGPTPMPVQDECERVACPEVEPSPVMGCENCPSSSFTPSSTASTHFNSTAPLSTYFKPSSSHDRLSRSPRGTEIITQGQASSFLFTVVGSVQRVTPARHELVLQNRRTHRNQTIYVYDPIIHRLREKNIVEVWLKPGSSKAEQIKQIA